MKCRDCAELEAELAKLGVHLAPGVNSIADCIKSLLRSAIDARRREDAMRRKLELHIEAHKEGR